MSKIAMPIPFCFIDPFEWKIAPEGDGGMPLITTDQAEAYKDACVREALEEAAALCDGYQDELKDKYYNMRVQHATGAVVGAYACAERIRSLLPKETI